MLHKMGNFSVELPTFGRVLGYFADAYTDKSNFITTIISVLAEPWFYGDLSTNESQERLHSKPSGTFLVRFSSVPEESWLTISQVQDNSSIKHQRVKHVAGGPYFIHENEQFDSLPDLLRAKGYTMTLPIGGSKYHPIFHHSAGHDHGYVGSS